MAGRLFLVQHRSDPDPLIGHVCEERKSAAPRVEHVFDIPYRGIHLTDVFPMIVAGQARVHQLASPTHVAQVLLQEPAQPCQSPCCTLFSRRRTAMDQLVCLGKIAWHRGVSTEPAMLGPAQRIEAKTPMVRTNRVIRPFTVLHH